MSVIIALPQHVIYSEHACNYSGTSLSYIVSSSCHPISLAALVTNLLTPDRQSLGSTIILILFDIDLRLPKVSVFSP